jgi:hypothetical protein
VWTGVFVRLWVPFPVVAFLLVVAALEQTRQTRLGADADRSDRSRYIEMLDSVMLGLWLCSTALDCLDFSGARCSQMCSVSVCSHSRLLCRINSNEKQGSSRLA